MKKLVCLFSLVMALGLITGCQSVDTSFFGGSFGRNSSAMVGGGAVAGQDYVIGLKPSEAAQQYFTSASVSDAKTVTVTPGDDKGTGVIWTDDGGIEIPPGVTIEFVNKGCCLDPHLPAPKSDEEMQFIKTSCLIPTQLQGTYKNLLRRAAAGDEDVKSNLQHLMWTLRTAGSNDAYANNLTDRQREILDECAEGGSFDGYCQDLHRFDGLKKLVKAQVEQVADKLQVEIGNVTYKVSDLLDPELGKQKVAAHLGELIHMNEYLPVVQSGFNFGELQKGIYTDIKGNGTLSFKAKVANSTSEPFVFYPMDYVAQVGSGQNMQGAFFAAADSTMRQRTTTTMPDEMKIDKDGQNDCYEFHLQKNVFINYHMEEIKWLQNREKDFIRILAVTLAVREAALKLLDLAAPGSGEAAKYLYDGGRLLNEGFNPSSNESLVSGINGIGSLAGGIAEKVYGTSVPWEVYRAIRFLSIIGALSEFTENANKIHVNHQRVIQRHKEKIDMAKKKVCPVCGRP